MDKGTVLLICKILFLLTMISSFSSKIWAKECSHNSDVFRCVKFLDNYDGDTFNVNIPRIHQFFGKKVPIRIKGIDAPERYSDSPCEKEKALEAKKVIHDLLVQASEIELRNTQRGKYFRIVADVYVDGKSLADELLYLGLAVPYDGGAKPFVNWCR